MARQTGAEAAFAKAIAQRRDSAKVREGWIRLAVNVLTLVLVLWLVFSFVLCIFRAQGNDMYPAVQDGDLIIGWRLGRDWRQGDLVVYEEGGKTQAGRVVATGGDIVDVTDSGTLTVNGTPESRALYETDGGDAIAYPYVVPEGEVFILGDFRTQAHDSREFGSVPETDIEATAIGLLRRRNF